MDFYPPKLKFQLLVVATSAMVLSAAAQQFGQSIVFSSPQNDDAQSVTPSLTPPNSPLLLLPSTMQAPVSPFSYDVPDNLLPPPPPNVSEQQRMKKLLDDRKNWTLMTPEEIFGTTKENPFQPTERDAFGNKKNETQLESYLDRQKQSPDGRTNDWQNDRADSPWDLTHDQDRANPFDSRRNDTTDSPQSLNRFFSSQRNSDVPANQNGIVSWDSFSTPPPQASVKPNLEQLAAMARFRQLLEPSPAPAEPSPNSRFFPVSKPVVDPNFTQPDFVPNPAGASFTPLSSGMGRPAGLTPLPGITTHLSSPAAVPAWAPQPPPWVSQGPQPFAAPQWKF
jgi:hypothetical protein